MLITILTILGSKHSSLRLYMKGWTQSLGNTLFTRNHAIFGNFPDLCLTLPRKVHLVGSQNQFLKNFSIWKGKVAISFVCNSRLQHCTCYRNSCYEIDEKF